MKGGHRPTNVSGLHCAGLGSEGVVWPTSLKAHVSIVFCFAVWELNYANHQTVIYILAGASREDINPLVPIRSKMYFNFRRFQLTQVCLFDRIPCVDMLVDY